MTDAPRPAAGWYPDPSGVGQRRYWDGQAWTEHVAEAAAVAPGPAVALADPAADRKALQDDGRRAKIAVFVGVPIYALTPALQGQQIRESRRTITELREQLETQTGTPGQPSFGVQPYSPSPVSTFGSAASLPNLVIGVIFLIWFHRAATVATRLGRPARRTPGWAVGGWFIPIGNFFLPYQSAIDVFRPGDDRRRLVSHWWAAYLVALVVNLPLGVIAGFVDDLAVTVAAGALSLVAWLFAAIKARELIDATNESLAAELS